MTRLGSTPQETHTVVIGAGPAGLACAACLKRRGIDHVLLERAPQVGPAWRGHYDRLHLHTNNRLSSLPYLRFGREVPRYPSREQVIAYLERYVAHHQLDPLLGHEALEVRRRGGGWITRTSVRSFASRNVVIATGYTGQPVRPEWPGLRGFPGDVRHSSGYRNGRTYRGDRVLVVGFGNSGGEIALDLAESGARPTLSVRGPVNILPREILGIPILALAIPLSRLPPRLADWLAAPILALSITNPERLGLKEAKAGPFRQIAEDRRIPLIDIGTISLIRRGGAEVRPEVERFDGERAIFADGRSAAFDAVVLATGYRPSFSEFLHDAPRVTDPDGIPEVSGGPTALPGLYFCGFYVSPTGMLREIGQEAKRIVRHIASRRPAGEPEHVA